MQTIEIKNFSVIKHCKIEIKRFTVLIGPQASGKSVIAKLVYFFHETLHNLFGRADHRENSAVDVDERIGSNFHGVFEDFFPLSGNFEIYFRIHEHAISIASKDHENGKKYIDVMLSSSLYNIMTASSYIQQEELITSKRNETIRHDNNVLSSSIDITPIFIPAARTVFLKIRSLFFTLYSSGYEIDYFLIAFGKMLERHTAIYRKTLGSSKNQDFSISQNIMNDVIHGKYFFEGDTEYIISEHGKVKIQDASSGQQESLPLLIVLTSLFSDFFQNEKFLLLIEELEAHLFPFAQKDLIHLLSLIHHHRNDDIFITTHSPYILSALNNLVTAAEADNEQNHEKVLEILGDACPVKYADVAAYNVENGTATSIMNDEDKLIGTNIIDEVSDVVAEQFDKLLDLLYPK